MAGRQREYNVEGKGDVSGQSQGSKSVESLKKLLHNVSSESAVHSDEICSLLLELVKSVSSSLHKPNSAQVISQAIEICLFACSHHNHRVRSSASESLKRLVKELMSSSFARVQQDLFHELKKNGETRSLCVALECFSSLFPFTRPSKCSAYAQNLVPVLLRLICREEESLHDALQEAFIKILPTLTPFMSLSNIKTIAEGLISHLKEASASYRRMASSSLASIVKFSRHSLNLLEWLLDQLFHIGCNAKASSELVNGVLMTLRQLFIIETFPFVLFKQTYCYVLSCLLYRSWSTDLSALECLHQLLKCTNAEFMVWLNSPLTEGQMAVEFWCSNVDSEDKSEAASLNEDLDTPLDNYFESDMKKDEESTTSQEVSPLSQDKPFASAISDLNCMAHKSDCIEPLGNLMEFLVRSVLTSSRISAQSLGMACITSAVEINPLIMTSLESVAIFLEAKDPKIRSGVAKLLATVVMSHLRLHHGNFSNCHAVASTAYEHLLEFLNDHTPMVLKSVCEALRLCLPTLSQSTQPTRVVDIVHRLLPLGENSYWLTKVELLQTLGCLDYTILSLYDRKVCEVILDRVVFKLIGDNDYRVRAMACECLLSLASTLNLDGNPLLAHLKTKSGHLFSHYVSTSIEFSFAGIADSLVKTTVSPPVGLDHVLWFLQLSLSASVHILVQKGCLEALHLLSIHYPPASLPEEWGCYKQPCTLIIILMDLLESSRLGWSVQGQSELLELSSSVFLSCSVRNLQHQPPTNSSWGALKGDDLVSFATNFLSHNVKLLSLFVHIIEQREPEIREKKIQIGVSPKKQGNIDALSPNKSKTTQILQDSLNIKPPIVPKDGMGYFANLPQFMKLYDACKAAYVNYQVSLEPTGADKFSNLLQLSHRALATLFEIALATDVGKYVEEILLYVSFTVKVDPCGALLCVQQLLNALFGMNIAAQRTHLYSPLISSLNFAIDSPQFVDSKLSFHEVAISNPVSLMKVWLEVAASISTSVSGEEGSKKGFMPIRKALVMKPVNSASEIRDYISYFEPLVVYALNQFPYTSSLLLQERVLFLIVQLMHLKVRYDLLDCHHHFFESVKKLIGVMESGMVKGGEALVPHLFQFLVLLASDQSKLMTIPQVMQMCDVVMASGHNVTTFAIPALQPLVLNLFVRSTRFSTDIDIQREVALNMLLRLIEHPRVIVLLTHVLDCYKRMKEAHWLEVSNKIYAALLPQVGKLNVVLDKPESVLALYQLLMTMSPESVTFKSLLAAILKPAILTSATQLLRWLATLTVLLQLMVSLFSESTLSSACSFPLHVPEFKSPQAVVEKDNFSADDTSLNLALFLHHSLLLAAKTLHQVCVQKCFEDYKFVPTLIGNMFVLFQILIPEYLKLKEAFSIIKDYRDLTKCFLSLSTYYPLLTLHYVNFLLLVKPNSTEWINGILYDENKSAGSILVQQGTIASICSKDAIQTDASLLAIAKSPALLLHHQSYLIGDFLKCVQWSPEAVGCLFQQLKLTGNEPPSFLQKYLCIASNVLSSETVKFLCAKMIPHSLSVISQAAVTVACKLVDTPEVAMKSEIASQLLEQLEPFQDKCPELISKLYSICGQSQLNTLPAQLGWMVEEDIDELASSKDFCLKMITKFCDSANSGEDRQVCSTILAVLDKEDLKVIVHGCEFPLVLLENCIVHGVWLSLNLKSSLDFSVSEEQQLPTNTTIHPLFEVSVKYLLNKFKENNTNFSLTRCFVRFLAAVHQFPKELLLDAETIDLLRVFCLQSLKNACDSNNILDMQNALDCCILALHLPEVREAVSTSWAMEAVAILYHLVKSVYPIKLPKLEVDHFSSGDEDLTCTKDQLLAILSVLLNRGLVPSPHTLHGSLKSFTFTLCRLSLWHGSLITPPVLKGEGVITYQVLDEALMESEVLLEYMQRCNSLGWLTRFQFEERWMQLLGVINQPFPSEVASQEEHHAYYLNVCSGIQAITSLLLGTTLRPRMGDPTSSVPMSVHRINEMLFLGSRPGRKLANIRKRLELEVLLESGSRTNIYSYYQNPLLDHYSSYLYPPLYTTNIEKEIGDTSVGYGQISLSSLWSILFKQTPGYSDSEEIDVKSCILSLIDLYVHWLRQPVHIILLNHMLQSIIMLSDLFATSEQFQWMLQMLLDLYENQHPQEDAHTVSLMVVGILKCVAVLKSESTEMEKVVKVVDKSLANDFMLQTACIRGVLYLSEESGNVLIPLCIAAITKYTVVCFQSFPSYPESHLMVLWALVVKIITDYSQNLKDQGFTANVLELITSIMMHPTISTAFFHSISLGLELLVLNFSLSAQERTTVINAASSRFVRSDQNKSVIALSLLLTCMYTGEEVDVASGLAEPSFNPMETAIQAREQVNNLMERLRHGPEVNITFIVDILPKVIIDFLPPMEVLQTVVTDFVSPHQSRPRFSASIMAETFRLLISNGHKSTLMEWVLLSLESFVQQEPESKAVWSLTCLLLAASSSDLHHLLFLCVCHWKQISDSLALQLLCVAAKQFYCDQNDEQKQDTMLTKFNESKYSSLLQVAQYCLTN